MNFQELTGRALTHLTRYDENNYIHSKIITDFDFLKKQALHLNIDLRMASSFRSYDSQLVIWNEKALRKRIILDRDESPISKDLSPVELMWSILNWSAIPGTSRHHWGTDLDLYDHSQYKEKTLKLINKEYSEGGENYQLGEFLKNYQNLFKQPYTLNSQGYQNEPWHYSHKLAYDELSELYTIDIFRQNIKKSPDLLLKDQILANLEEIYLKYIQTS